MEEWRDVPGYEGLYQVNNLGRIKNTKTGRLLKRRLNDRGYDKVNLKGKQYSVARLVALTFQDICGEWFEGAQVDHINTIRDDNRPENLRWVCFKDQFQNELTKKHMKGRVLNHPSTSRWVIKLSKNNEILHFYPSVMEAERETGIAASSISRCCNGIRHTAGEYVWKYAE